MESREDDKPRAREMIGRTLLDILYPPTCVSCEAGDASWLCRACQGTVFVRRHSRCPKCGVKPTDGHACQETWPFASVINTGSYADPVLRQALTRFKYHSAACLVDDLKNWLRLFRQNFLEPWPWAGLSEMTVTSIPADPIRLRQRGMDHAALLADAVREVLVPWADRAALLARQRHIAANANLPANEIRAANVKDAFRVTHPIHTPVLLVDDIVTTGATAAEAAQVLLAAGVPEVHLFTFASGS